jgi:hypothetical protein
VAVLDPKWHVPDSFDTIERELVLPPPAGFVGTQPVLGILSVRALEDQASGDGVLALYAWQVCAGASAIAAQTIDRLATNMDMSGLELLMLGHAYVATGTGQGAAFEIAQRARKVLKQPVTEQSLDASLLLAVGALPYGTDRVRALLGMLDAELQHGTDEHRAVHALIGAAADPASPLLDDAHQRFTALDDQLGLAQCALLAYARESAGAKQPDLLRGYLEHAIYRFEADGRPEWAARILAHALIPLVADAAATEVPALLGRAVTLGVQAKSYLVVDAVLRLATKLGYAASVTTFSQFDPPSFAKSTAPAASAAPAEPPSEPKKKKAPAKKGKKAAAT